MALFLVTGGCGFIGSSLAHALVAGGDRVRIVDNLSTGRLGNVASLLRDHPSQVELWRGELTDTDLLDQALVGVDFILHHAAIPSVPWSIDHPFDCERINTHGTLQLLEAARRNGRIRRLVFAASCAAYGDLDPDKPKRESDLPVPLSPYAISKLAGEHLCAVYSRIHSVPAVALRYFNVFGPRQDPSSHYAAAIPRFICAALGGQPPTLFGDGLQSRDFVFVENIIQANLLACQADAAQVSGQVINIGGGKGLALLEVIGMLGELLGREIRPTHEPARPGEVRHSFADIAKAGALLGYQPRVAFRDGLAQTVKWYRENRPQPNPAPKSESTQMGTSR